MGTFSLLRAGIGAAPSAATGRSTASPPVPLPLRRRGPTPPGSGARRYLRLNAVPDAGAAA